jgi:hypothetical protein
MRKLLFTLLALGLFSTAMVGCRASADVDPHGQTTIGVAR